MQTVGEHGALGLFRGMGAPFATVAIYNACIFAARGQMENLLQHADGMPPLCVNGEAAWLLHQMHHKKHPQIAIASLTFCGMLKLQKKSALTISTAWSKLGNLGCVPTTQAVL